MSDARVKINLTLSEPLYDLYAAEAKKNGRSVEGEIVRRLEACKEYTAIQPLYFNDSHRQQLAQAIGHVIPNPEFALAHLKQLLALKVGGVEVPLSDRLQARLRTRVFRGHTMEGVIRREVTEGLERFVGMR